jgi:DNA phosphorothioation-associated putative methyltransferase
LLILNLDLVNNFEKIVSLCQNSNFGKKLPHAFYIHLQALPFLDPLLQEYEKCARNIYPYLQESTLVKFNLKEPKISYLFYPDFDLQPHPSIHKSIIVNLLPKKVNIRVYSSYDNPPILHRKETFVTPDYPLWEKFAHLTKVEEELGLLDNAHFIGTQNEWHKLLQAHGLDFEDHFLISPLARAKNKVTIDRHKAALVRNDLSVPVKIAMRAGLFAPQSTFFDYGCGHGGDLERIAQQGYQSSGWDPFYRPDSPLVEADIVNLGYVINVIENVAERREALLKAYQLTRQVLIVSAQVLIHHRQRGLVAYGDGIITERNTFQKYYQQEELKTYIDGVLKTDSIPIGLGIYLVFRSPALAHNFRVSRIHSKVRAPRILLPLKKFEDYQELLTPLMKFYTERGRLPLKGEYCQESELKREFGTFKRAFKVILQVTQPEEWEAIADKRRQEILIYLALSHFTGRPTMRKLPTSLKNDIRVLFGNYQAACFLADEMLLSLRNLDLIKTLCQQSNIGIILKNAFFIHLSALESLPALLRLFEGCASRTIGRLENANVIKFHLNIPKISYLYYPHFDEQQYPRLETSMQIDLRDLQVRYRDFYHCHNPPLLDEKEKLVTPEYSFSPQS